MDFASNPEFEDDCLPSREDNPKRKLNISGNITI